MKNLRLLTDCGELSLVTDENGSGRVDGGLMRDTCPSCNEPLCCHDCPGSSGDNRTAFESEDDVTRRLSFNFFLDAVETIVLAHACVGINVEEYAYVEGINAAIGATRDNLF